MTTITIGPKSWVGYSIDGEGPWRVSRPDGKRYVVRYGGSGSGDPDFMGIWDCTCPARGDCKHAAMVVAYVDGEIDEDGRDMYTR